MSTKSVHHKTNVTSKEFVIIILFLKGKKEATIAGHTQSSLVWDVFDRARKKINSNFSFGQAAFTLIC